MQAKIDLSHPVFEAVKRAAEKLQLETYVVGGYVRDQLLNRSNKDFDFVCIGSGIALAEATAAELSPNLHPTIFKNFGTANFKWQHADVEFVGARKESYNRDSRKPAVEEGTFSDDQNRRDFTINALAVSMNQSNYGTLVDSFNGLQDLDAKIIRTPLDADITFSDDPLRMMRAIRFATQLDFEIQAETFDAIKRNAERIHIISQERITDELNKIILARKPSKGFILLEEAGLLKIIFPEFNALKGVENYEGKGHKDNFFHTLQVLDNITRTTKDLWLRWAAILHDIAKPPTKRFVPGEGWTFHGHEVLGSKWVPKIFKRMKLPMGGEMKFVQKMVFLHLRPIALTKEEITDSALRRLLFEAGDDIESLLMLCEADITTKNRQKQIRYLERFEKVREKLKEVEKKDRIRNFQPPVSGEFIMETFGIQPCKEIGIIKEAIKEAILEGNIQNNFDEAHSMMLQLGKELGLKIKQ
ncbi:MAG TPA: HD domain-containing protein [Chitinophagales bacterium]|nr:HD domain-containing protein [Chitinophagales bacterium]HRP40327.1 HD domain-containing protein [Chitinophagales bacterium]